MLLLLSALAFGCRPEEQIVHYRAPKSIPPAAPAPPAQGKPEGMLAAIVPHGSQAWFFKLTGPVDAIVAKAEPFHKFMESVRFADDEPQYDPPADWRAQGASGLRHETFLIPSAGKPLELAISTLPKPQADDDGYLLSNLNRWRGQMGLEPVDISRLKEFTSHLKLADGTTATLVAMAGSAAPSSAVAAASTTTADAGSENAGSGGADGQTDGILAAIVPEAEQAWFFKLSGPAEAVAQEREAFGKFIQSVHFEAGEPRYSPPADWRAQGAAGMRFETFRIPSDGRTLELAVSTLVKPPGDAQKYLLDNVNRWRNQLGLAPIGPDELTGQTSSVKLAGGQTATLVDLVGKLQSGGNAPPFAPGK